MSQTRAAQAAGSAGALACGADNGGNQLMIGETLIPPRLVHLSSTPARRNVPGQEVAYEEAFFYLLIGPKAWLSMAV